MKIFFNKQLSGKTTNLLFSTHQPDHRRSTTNLLSNGSNHEEMAAVTQLMLPFLQPLQIEEITPPLRSCRANSLETSFQSNYKTLTTPVHHRVHKNCEKVDNIKFPKNHSSQFYSKCNQTRTNTNQILRKVLSTSDPPSKKKIFFSNFPQHLIHYFRI